MTDRSILFSGPMVPPVLDGSKTLTRRIMKQATGPSLSVGMDDDAPGVAELSWLWGDGPGHDVHETIKRVMCPYGQPGDRLRVKEAAWMWCERRPNGKTKTGRDKWLYVPMREAPIHYAADHPKMPMLDVVSPDTGNKWGWRFKIGRFLPGWASRITLEVTGVRVERLQDISEADAISEGIPEDGTPCPQCGYAGWVMHGGDPVQCKAAGCGDGAVDEYRALWNQINGPGSWDANPWVWVIEFKMVKP